MLVNVLHKQDWSEYFEMFDLAQAAAGQTKQEGSGWDLRFWGSVHNRCAELELGSSAPEKPWGPWS